MANVLAYDSGRFDKKFRYKFMKTIGKHLKQLSNHTKNQIF